MKFVTHVLYAQAMSYVTNALKIKEAFPTLPNKKVLKMHNAAFAQPVNKPRKSNTLLKNLLENRPLSQYPMTLLKTLWAMLAPIYSKSTPC